MLQTGETNSSGRLVSPAVAVWCALQWQTGEPCSSGRLVSAAAADCTAARIRHQHNAWC